MGPCGKMAMDINRDPSCTRTTGSDMVSNSSSLVQVVIIWELVGGLKEKPW